MDSKMQSIIINSCEEAVKDLEPIKDTVDIEAFPSVDENVIKSLAKAITFLLSYKVSREAHQRYSVRTQIIEILRDWSIGSGTRLPLSVFTDGRATLNFLLDLLEKRLNERLDEAAVGSIGKILDVMRTLMRPEIQAVVSRGRIERLLSLVVKLNCLNEETSHLLVEIVEEVNNFELLESTYSHQREFLVESVLIDACNSCIEDSFSNSNYLPETLLDVVVNSPLIFRHLSCYLNEILLTMDFSNSASDFVQIVLHDVEKHAREKGKLMLSLYPKNLQFVVGLLSLTPEQHSDDARQLTLNGLREIYFRSEEDVTILLSHFPSWLETFSKSISEGAERTVKDIIDESEGRESLEDSLLDSS